MKKRKTGSREEYITYLNENKQMDRSLMAFNLSAIYGLKKKEAANMIREWYFTECNTPKTSGSEDNEEAE